MNCNSSFQHVLDEWSAVVRPRVEHALEDHLFYYDETRSSLFEYDELEDQLHQLSLVEIAALPWNTFGAIGDDTSMLKPEAFLWLLPVMLQFAARSKEETYAWGVISRLLQQVASMPIWQQIKRRVSKDTLNCVHEYAKQCCRLGWEGTTERRVQKRLNACEQVFR